MPKHPTNQEERRRHLRQTATKPEQLLWAALRNRQASGLKFRRQHSVGPFIVDFICLSKNIILEVDGQYHSETGVADRRRQDYLESQGYTVLRVTNEDVLADVDAVVSAIFDVTGKPPHPNPLPIVLPHRARPKLPTYPQRQHDGGEGL